MTMTYDGTMVLPNNYVVVDQNEMTYVEGGGTVAVQFGANGFLYAAISTAASYLTVKGVTALCTAAMAAIAVGVEAGTAGLATVIIGQILIAFGGLIAAVAGGCVAYGMNWLKGKKFNLASAWFLPNFTLKI